MELKISASTYNEISFKLHKPWRKEFADRCDPLTDGLHAVRPKLVVGPEDIYSAVEKYEQDHHVPYS